MKFPPLPEKTRAVVEIFAEISKIPRCSGNEGKMAEWLLSWAAGHDFDALRDATGNVIIRVPASPGLDKKPVIILQSHMDMVCEKGAGSSHTFATDPIHLIFEDKWLRADNTTLGADNGIGMAFSLALAENKDLAHPPLELLFTVEEETGLTGAQHLQGELLKGLFLLNIDSEEEGTFTIGCAGGESAHIEFPLFREPFPDDFLSFQLTVSGLRGGHSGTDIQEKRGNATKILADILAGLQTKIPLRILSVKGGTRSNVIPREASAILTFSPSASEKAGVLVTSLAAVIRKECMSEEKNLSISFSRSHSTGPEERAFTQEESRKCIRLLQELPHGVYRMSEEMKGMVETSNNLAIVATKEDAVEILCFQRSSKVPELQALTSRIGEQAEKAGANFHRDGFYPGWAPDLHSDLLIRCQQIYQEVFAEKARVTMTHGGLECGILGSKLPGVDMISLGPTIKNAHSPGEKLHLPALETSWDFLRAFLASFGS